MIKEAEHHAILEQLKTTPSEELESDILEFKLYASKQALHNSKDLAEEFSALANCPGGHIMIGVRDSSDVHAANWEASLQAFRRSIGTRPRNDSPASFDQNNDCNSHSSLSRGQSQVG